ncbi:GNAT family N-acetyltransferase [Herpetosiphon sp. NSE202]|uniref:GNAT family N-acetyltransferase n=1 Tax=Herpetosiphon sp. NSE202 TaxID=3351349 RepID=UPI0036394994
MTEQQQAIQFANPPQIDGFQARFFRDNNDFSAMAKIFNASSKAFGHKNVVGATELQNQYHNTPNSDLTQDLIILEVDQQAIGYAFTHWYDEAVGNRIFRTLAHIKPEWINRGIGHAILTHQEQRQRAVHAANPTNKPAFLQTHASDTNSYSAKLYAEFGYQPIRHSFSMKRDLSQPIGSQALPEGIEVRPSTPELYRQIWQADAESFRDHWGFSEPSETDFQRWTQSPLFQPAIWQVAWSGDQVVGMVLNYFDQKENAEYNRQRGYTESISVRRPWRKQGVASALINRSLAMFREMGMTEAALGVDSENLTGALSVYQQCGFEVEYRSSTHRKPLA